MDPYDFNETENNNICYNNDKENRKESLVDLLTSSHIECNDPESPLGLHLDLTPQSSPTSVSHQTPKCRNVSGYNWRLIKNLQDQLEDMTQQRDSANNKVCFIFLNAD